MKPFKSMTAYTALVNIIHIALCMVIYLTRLIGIYDSTAVRTLFFALEIILWFVFGIVYALGSDNTRQAYSLFYAFLAVLPIGILTLTCFLMSAYGDVTVSAWAKFFFVGSSVNFFNRPAAVLAAWTSLGAYVLYAVNIALMFLFSFCGAALGTRSEGSVRRRKKRKKIKSVRRRNAPAEKRAVTETKGSNDNEQISDTDL
jgi:hypothetical protein